jgi:hypothetical protein
MAKKKKTTADTEEKPREPSKVELHQARKTPRAEKGESTGGRPPFVWDDLGLAALQELALVRNTVETMAIILGVGKRTLERLIAWDDNKEPEDQHPCAIAYAAGANTMVHSLRAEQYQTAISRGRGAPTMLIWLGKQHLGQRDVRPIELTGKDGKPLELDIEYMPAIERQLLSFLRNKQPKTFSRTGDEGSNGSGSNGANGSGE